MFRFSDEDIKMVFDYSVDNSFKTLDVYRYLESIVYESSRLMTSQQWKKNIYIDGMKTKACNQSS